MAEESSPRECGPGVWQIALPLAGSFLGAVNVYLFEEEHGVTLIDCGLGTDQTWGLFLHHLDGLRIPVDRIGRVLLTHTHHDHSGLAGRIAATTGATVWVHQSDVDFFDRRYVQANRFKRRLYEWLCSHGTPVSEAEDLAFSEQTWSRPAHQLPPAETYRVGQRIEIGSYEFSVVWTPGHTPGHVCFADAAHQTVVCGDHILPNVSPNVGMQPDSEINPLAGYLESLNMFAQSDFRTALPGHGEPFFDIQARALQLWTHQMDRRQLVLDFLVAGPLTAYQLGERVWADARPTRWTDFRGHLRRNAMATLLAHLELLREMGEVARWEELPYRYELS